MKRTLLALSLFALTTSVGSAATVICTVTSGTVLTQTLGGGGYVIDGAVGSNLAAGSGSITCPSVTASVGNTITSYGVFASIDYAGGPFGTVSGTTVSQTLTLVGGPLGGLSIMGLVSGGNSSNNVVPPVPFQFGTTLLASVTSYAGFTVNVSSVLAAGGPVGAATGQVRLQYEETPEPSTYALISVGLVGLGLARRRHFAGK
jgi:hypothetical protein